MKKYFDLRFLWIFCFLVSLSYSQAQGIANKIENYAVKYSPERAYIHYDKHTYTPGEMIWFKAYLLNELLPAEESKTFYVDWIDDNGIILQHTVAPLINATARGQFEIPAGYKGKNISVRAYTRWMLNFDSSFLYSKTIPIINNDSAGSPQKILIQPTIDFFPEGGNLIAGVNSKVAFKATDQWGRPVKIKGVVLDGAGKKIDSIKVIHDGMGYFFITPQTGVKYKAKWSDEKKVERTTELPEVKPEGAALQVKILPDSRNFNISLSPGLAQKLDTVHIVGTMFQHTVFMLSKPTNAKEIGGILPIHNLPYGILTITVFDKNWRPLTERITYINNNAQFTVKTEFEVERWGLSYRARDEVRIKVPDSLASNLSIAVTDLAIGVDSSENIISRLMLTSELKGKVYNPAYYFSDNSEKTQQNLDLVMLTNGWRRFNWEAIVSGKMPPLTYTRDSTFMSLSGKLMGVMPAQIGNGAAIVVMMKQKNTEGNMFLMPVDRNGVFNDPSIVIFDTAQVYYQIQDKSLKETSVQFMPYRLRTPTVGKNWGEKIFPDTTGSAYHKDRSGEAFANSEKLKYKELEAVIVSAKGKSKTQLMDEKYTSGMFGGDGIQFDLVNDPFASSAIDIFTYLQGKVAGLQITGQGQNATLNWRGGSPQLYIDEMPADVNFVSSINVNDVAYIKAFRPPFMGGFNGANGAIAIYTRRGDDIRMESGKGLPGSKVEGYTVIREFYSPKYYSRDVAPGADRDVRTTIYWNPNVLIDPKKKEVVLSFYNNDVTDAFRVIIEGMTSDGRLIHYMTTME